jgi:hypothetical protein
MAKDHFAATRAHSKGRNQNMIRRQLKSQSLYRPLRQVGIQHFY